VSVRTAGGWRKASGSNPSGNCVEVRSADERVPKELAEVVARHDGWHGWVGVTGKWYARRPGYSPPMFARSDPDPAALEAAIVHAAGAWPRCPDGAGEAQ
jgi:hypothetical protein